MDYITTVSTKITNNTGGYIATWPAGKTFSTGSWIKNGLLYLGNNNAGENINRWIAVGTYEPVTVTPPPTVPPVTIKHERYSYDDGKTWTDDKYWKLEP